MRRAAPYAILAAGAVLSAAPLLWMIGTAFKTLPEAMSPSLAFFPRAWQWHNVVETFEAAPFAVYFRNTAVVSLSVTLLVVLTSLMAGYAFARLRFPGRSLWFGFVIATMMIPFEVALIPNFVIVGRLDWTNTYAALIVPWCANAFSIFLVRQAFLQVPSDYFDAARIDGCGHLRFLALIAAPLIKPAVVTVALFAFLGSYNALVWPLVVAADQSKHVIQVGLTVFSNNEGVRMHLLMCASLIVILPTVVLYFALQKYFLESSLSAGIKG